MEELPCTDALDGRSTGVAAPLSATIIAVTPVATAETPSGTAETKTMWNAAHMPMGIGSAVHQRQVILRGQSSRERHGRGWTESGQQRQGRNRSQSQDHLLHCRLQLSEP
jgi:hypothetical protein